MLDSAGFGQIATTTLADVLTREQVMDCGMRLFIARCRVRGVIPIAAAKDAAQSLDQWEAEHRRRIEAALVQQGYAGP